MIERDGDRLRVTGAMLIGNATALLEAGRAILRDAAPGRLVLDLGQVAETDSSALALIFSLLRTARAKGIDLVVAEPPASMQSQASLYGVVDALPLA